MAEYFPLIDRAVAGLPEASTEARRAIYERARTALVTQLRKTEPPVPEDDIARESAALDEAIARVEAKFADHGTGVSPPRPAASRPRLAPPAAPRSAATVPEKLAVASTPPAARRSGAPGLPTGKVPPVMAPPSRERPVIGPAPTIVGEPRPGAAPADAPGAARQPRAAMPLRPAVPRPTAGAAGPGPAPADRGAEAEAGAAALPPAADLAVARDEPPERAAADEGDAAAAKPRTGGDPAVAPPAPPRPREGSTRPAAPRPTAPRRFGWPALLVAAVIALVMVGVGVAAWRLRDRPEQLAAAHPAAAASEAPQAGKIVERAGSGQDEGSDGGAAGSSTGASVPAPVGQNGGGDAGPAIAVAQRAALLIDAPDDPQKLKTYPGTVVWHLDSVSPGQGLPLSPAVKADIDIPDAKLKATVVVQKNLEPQLPASHTIEIRFLPQPGYTLGNIVQINVPEMRKDDAPAGDALVGVPVAIDTNSFLVGLSRGGAEAQNKRLITERNWFDVSVLFAPKRPGKLTFEKGADGERIWEQAFAAWGDGKGASGTTP